MYKLILVDDETEIRHGLKEVIPFEELGFTVVGEAGNGLEALTLLETLHPDLILTDIRMPMMDGLTLCKKVREKYPTTQFLILTGYDDYEYVREAIEVKTMKYLLKPISAAEFCEVLKDTKLKLDREFLERNNVEKLKAHLKVSFPLLKESLLASVFSGAIKKERALEMAGRYEMAFQAPAYLAALCRIGDQEAEGRIPDQDLLTFSVMNILTEVLCEHGPAHVFHYNGMLALLLLLKGPEQKQDKLTLIKEARETVVYYLKCGLHIGVGAMVLDADKLPLAADQALTALEQSVITLENGVMSFEDLHYGYRADISPDADQLRQLSSLIKLGENDAAQAVLKDMMAICRSAKPGAKAYQAYLMEIFVSFVRIVPEMTLDRTDFSEAFDKFSRTVFLNCPPIDEAERLLSGLLKSLVDAVTAGRVTTGLLLSRQAEDYLKENYENEALSLETLCNHLHISPSYFSMVFKKETRKTFHQYLTELRMDRALKLLASTDYKTAQVAQLVGIPDPSYFSYCFKKHFGYSPSSLKKQKE